MEVFDKLNEWLREVEYVVVSVYYDEISNEIKLEYYDEYGNLGMRFFS